MWVAVLRLTSPSNPYPSLKKTKPNSINDSERETSVCFTAAATLCLSMAPEMIYCTVLAAMLQYNKSVFTEPQWCHVFPDNLSTHNSHIKVLCSSWLNCIITPEATAKAREARERSVRTCVSKPRCLFGKHPRQQQQKKQSTGADLESQRGQNAFIMRKLVIVWKNDEEPNVKSAANLQSSVFDCDNTDSLIMKLWFYVLIHLLYQMLRRGPMK